MKRQIRAGIFETNSSSMHSLVVRNMKEKLLYTDEEILEELKNCNYVNDEGTIFDASWEDNWYYGRAPFEILSDFSDKLRYVYSYYCYEETHETREQIVEILKKHIPTLKSFSFPTDAYVDGYCPFWKASDGTLKIEEFLLNKKYVVIVDGDEYNEWGKLLGAGIINTKVFTKIFMG